MPKSTTPASTPPSGAANSKVDWYFGKHENWQQEIRQLRTIVLSCKLTEELKWGCPCYTQSGNNIVLIHVFKEYCALLFFKGALLKDEHDILIQQTKNVQAARQIRFSNLPELVKIKHIVKAYILEAIQIDKSGLHVTLKKTAEFEMPDEFKNRLKKLPSLKKAFYALTPGRQRGYLLHFSSAKQSRTREARVDKCVERILDGKGLDD